MQKTQQTITKKPADGKINTPANVCPKNKEERKKHKFRSKKINIKQ